MAPSEDFLSKVEVDASFHPVNSVFLWHKFSAGNWKVSACRF